MIVDPQLNLAELARPLLPELRHILQPGPEALQEHWHRHRFEYLDLAAELPALLPEAIARLRAQPALSPPPAAQPASRHWLPLGRRVRRRRRPGRARPQTSARLVPAARSQTNPLSGSCMSEHPGSYCAGGGARQRPVFLPGQPGCPWAARAPATARSSWVLGPAASGSRCGAQDPAAFAPGGCGIGLSASPGRVPAGIAARCGGGPAGTFMMVREGRQTRARRPYPWWPPRRRRSTPAAAEGRSHAAVTGTAASRPCVVPGGDWTATLATPTSAGCRSRPSGPVSGIVCSAGPV